MKIKTIDSFLDSVGLDPNISSFVRIKDLHEISLNSDGNQGYNYLTDRIRFNDDKELIEIKKDFCRCISGEFINPKIYGRSLELNINNAIRYFSKNTKQATIGDIVFDSENREYKITEISFSEDKVIINLNKNIESARYFCYRYPTETKNIFYDPDNSKIVYEYKPQTNNNADIFISYSQVSALIVRGSDTARKTTTEVAMQETFENNFAGKGTIKDPYIVTKENFKNILGAAANGETIYYELESDINLDDSDIANANDSTSQKYLINYELQNISIDGNNHEITVASNTSFKDNVDPFLIKATKDNVTIKNLKISCGMPLIERPKGQNLVFENITTFGTVSGSDNNQSARFIQVILANQGTPISIKFKNCINNTNIIGSGYVAAFIGRIGTSTVDGDVYVTFDNCENNGDLISSHSSYGASMFISNATGYRTKIYFTIKDCVNNGNILYRGTALGANLLYGGWHNTEFYLNNTKILENTAEEYKIKVNNILASCVENNGTYGKTFVSTLNTQDNEFIIPTQINSTNIKKYDLIFSFSGLLGANYSYKISFTDQTRDLVHIPVNSWIDEAGLLNKGVTSVELEENLNLITKADHPEYTECRYFEYTLNEQTYYVYKDEFKNGGRIAGTVAATLFMMDETNAILGIAQYVY